MHQIYEDQGSFNFIYQLPKIIYSTIISVILNLILKLLSLTENAILDFKSLKDKENLEIKVVNLHKKIKIKILLYFIISSILLLFFWYYIGVFCAVYKNTQIHLITDTIISFLLSICYPFAINLIPGLLRIPSLAKQENKVMYNISKIIQIF